MSFKLATAALLAVTVSSGSAFACMGPTVLYSDNFQQQNPAWQAAVGRLTVSGGYAQLTPAAPGQWSLAGYTGSAMDNADMCINVVSPTVSDPGDGIGGVMFGLGANAPEFFTFTIAEAGGASVGHWQNGTWSYLVQWRAAPAVKPGPNAVNALRITWKGTTGSTYLNNQPFATFTIPHPLQNTIVGLYGQGDTSVTSPATWKFGNLKITNVP